MKGLETKYRRLIKLKSRETMQNQKELGEVIMPPTTDTHALYLETDEKQKSRNSYYKECHPLQKNWQFLLKFSILKQT